MIGTNTQVFSLSVQDHPRPSPLSFNNSRSYRLNVPQCTHQQVSLFGTVPQQHYGNSEQIFSFGIAERSKSVACLFKLHIVASCILLLGTMVAIRIILKNSK